jgi:hypothetical protein
MDQLPVSTKFEVLILMSIYVYIWFRYGPAAGVDEV